MRKFIDRIHEAIEYDYAWATASLPLKVIVFAVLFFKSLLQGFIVIAMTVAAIAIIGKTVWDYFKEE